jgi:hypothetical protein
LIRQRALDQFPALAASLWLCASLRHDDPTLKPINMKQGLNVLPSRFERRRKLKEMGVELRILSLNLDTATPTGKLMPNLMGSIAEFERELMLERQREGIARAKAQGA